MPTEKGRARISLSAAGFLPHYKESSTTVEVGWAWLLLCVSAFGGCFGGLVAVIVKKEGGWQRILVGGVVGAVIYVLWVIGVTIGKVPPSAWARNQIVAGMFSIILGFGGSGVLELLLSAWGLIHDRRGRNPEGPPPSVGGEDD